MDFPLKIFNSLTRKKEVFKPISTNKKIGLYVCGMTVYDYCHIGHARILVFFDIVARHLRSLGYDLTYVRNITDIDDKIIERSKQKKQSTEQLTQFFIEKMNEDERNLGNLAPDYQPKATESIEIIIAMITQLIAKNMAYQTENSAVYFKAKEFKNYGALSAKKLDELRVGARVEIDEFKQDPLDFILWKPAKADEPSWQSPWGLGRPGWHIECSAMSCSLLGNHFDLHGGGMDLKFPHHENEIAQSQAANDNKFVNTWVHVGFVNINDKKMSKSLNNFFTIREVFKHYPSEVVRYFLLSSYYRKPLNYSEDNLNLASQVLCRLYSCLEDYDDNYDGKMIEYYDQKFKQKMNDDFNTPEVLAVLFDLVKTINQFKDSKNNKNNLELINLQFSLKKLANQLGLLQQKASDFLKKQDLSQITQTINTTEIEKQIALRNQARNTKNFKLADKIRAELLARGIVLEDKADKTIWRIDAKY